MFDAWCRWETNEAIQQHQQKEQEEEEAVDIFTVLLLTPCKSLHFTSFFAALYFTPLHSLCPPLTKLWRKVHNEADWQWAAAASECKLQKKEEKYRGKTQSCDCVVRRERRRGEGRRGAEEKPPRKIYKAEHLAWGSRETRWSETKETKLKCHHRLV